MAPDTHFAAHEHVGRWTRSSFLLLSVLFLLSSLFSSGVATAEEQCIAGDACLSDIIEQNSNNSETAPPPSQSLSNDPLIDNMVAWLKDNGALFSPKVELRHAIRDDATSMRGMFVMENATLKEGEIILSIPWNLVVQEDEHRTECATVQLIHQDMAQENPTPYGAYLKAQPKNYVPHLWSQGGKDLLDTVTGKVLDPHDLNLTRDMLEECKDFNASMDPLYIHAWQMVLTRSDDDLMVPYYDLINHRNGNHTNTNHAVVRDYVFNLIASKPVPGGEQLYASYNQCNFCANRVDWHGTPEILREYGFVEDYPRRFVLLVNHPDMARIKFDLDYDPAVDELILTPYTPLDPKSLEWLQNETQRLQELELELASFPLTQQAFQIYSAIRPLEWDMIWKLHAAYVEAFESFLQVSPDMKVSTDIWELADTSWYVEDELIKLRRRKKEEAQELRKLLMGDDDEEEEDEWFDDEEWDDEEDEEDWDEDEEDEEDYDEEEDDEDDEDEDED